MPLYENKYIIINEKWTTFTLTTTKNKEDINNINSIIECENELKDYYNIPSSNYLYILIISVSKEETINSKIGFEVYYPLTNDKLEKLDLGICNNTLNDNEITKCSKYSIKSFLNDSCISCFPPYFPVQDDKQNANSFAKCYKNPIGYYLDSDNFYKKCYSSCETCDKNGSEENHNCLLCASGYIYELIVDNHKNCYERCKNYYYYNSTDGKYYCTPDLLCPKYIYKLLIPKKNQCIDDCKNDPDYQI